MELLGWLYELLIPYAGAIIWFGLLICAGAFLTWLFEKFINSRAGTPIVKLYEASHKWPNWLQETLPFVWGIGFTVLLFCLIASL